MSTETRRRSVTVERTKAGHFTITNPGGGSLTIGTGDGPEFSPTELLLAAIGGCTSIDVDALTSRRAEPLDFRVVVEGTKIRDDHGNRMVDLQVTFRVSFPDGPEGDAAREMLPGAVQRSHDRLCTVSRTVERGTPITTRIDN